LDRAFYELKFDIQHAYHSLSSTWPHDKTIGTKLWTHGWSCCDDLIIHGFCWKIKKIMGEQKKESRCNSDEDANPENVHKEPK